MMMSVSTNTATLETEVKSKPGTLRTKGEVESQRLKTKAVQIDLRVAS